MTRRVTLWIVAAMAVVTLSGCVPGSGGGPGPDETAVMNAVARALETFEESVELYDVDGMLGCLAEPDFALTLVEATVQPPITMPPKSYADLEAELVADEATNLLWRRPVAEGGRGYVLDLELGEATFSRVTETSARATLTFTVVESADGIEPKVTDQGTMAWEFAKITGDWVAVSAIITFEPVEVADPAAAGARASSLGAGRGRTCFGFGRLVL